MKVRHAVAFLGVILLSALIASHRQTPGPPEPSFAGRTLTEWGLLNPRAPNGNPSSREAREAILKIGTNALPSLLAWLAADPDHSAVKQAAYHVLVGLPGAVKPKMALKWAESDLVLLHLELAPSLFPLLGPDAAAAIPDLERIASDLRGRRGAYFATYILGDIGPQSLPALQRIARNPACPTRSTATKEADRLLAAPHSGSSAAH